ncbi:DUF1329 domain-containing protein [Pandoraea pulmonicola]|uniref:Protein of uncharacterized function (DUF1329) n=1 Tax=Pandoraea pulmonicola TaxID=93221 RepID=A0AAJ4ZG94_PANPU|nr:DUF1329 domain-containing protein [Pandoraea pulmonicola]SUA92778.1 Protein of uncharacterised function (DUF1329) [Pandoraea pulmonicola]
MKSIQISSALALTLSLMAGAAHSAVSAEDAAQLKTTLTPFGAERAGNKDGTIPAWTGAPTPNAGLNNGRRSDPFAAEKPLNSITAKNMAQYSGQLTEGTKALLQKYPNTFRVDVYKTHRTAIAPQWVYDNTAKNAVNAKLVETSSGPVPQGVYGGIPFPIPKSGLEVMWNHQLRWRGESWHLEGKAYQLTPDGTWVNVVDASNDVWMPYYAQTPEKFNNEYYMIRSLTRGPAIRAGEAITDRMNLDESKTAAWVYLTGQRRVRKLPNSCCDTLTPFSAGVATFDEVSVFTGRLDKFDWKLLGKREMYIPYNANRALQPAKDSELLGQHHLNPDFIRWELHRVWVVEATLKSGERHTSPKSRYYVDEDSWDAVMAERYDANGQLARIPFALPVVMSDVPATEQINWGVYDLTTGSSFVSGITNERNAMYVPKRPAFKDATFTPDAMAGEGVR